MLFIAVKGQYNSQKPNIVVALAKELALRLGHNQSMIDTSIGYINAMINSKKLHEFDDIPSILERLLTINNNFERSQDDDNLCCPEEILCTNVLEVMNTGKLARLQNDYEIDVEAAPINEDDNSKYRLLLDEDPINDPDKLRAHDHNIKKK